MKGGKALECIIEVPFSSRKEAADAAKSLEKELGFRSKSEGSVECEGETLRLKVSAESLASLHASANNALRLLKVVQAAFAAAKR